MESCIILHQTPHIPSTGQLWPALAEECRDYIMRELATRNNTFWPSLKTAPQYPLYQAPLVHTVGCLPNCRFMLVTKKSSPRFSDGAPSLKSHARPVCGTSRRMRAWLKNDYSPSPNLGPVGTKLQARWCIALLVGSRTNTQNFRMAVSRTGPASHIY